MPDLADRLDAIERDLDAGSYRSGPWQRFVAQAGRCPPSELRSLEAAIDRVSEKLHRRRRFPSLPTERGIALEVLATAMGLVLLCAGAARGSAWVLVVAATALAVGLQPLLKVSAGLALGIGYSYFYVWHGEPRFKFRFGSYLASAWWKRVLVHLAGIVGSPLGVGVAWAVARAGHPTLSRVLLVLIAVHVALSILVFVLAAAGVGRLPWLGPIRFNSAGAAGHELWQAFRGRRKAAGRPGVS